MTLPDPLPGLVIRYAYLWRDEASQGLEDGRKERPCAVVLSARSVDGRTVVLVAPITHAPPHRPELAIELPETTKRRLGLDDQRSWIIANDLNRFVWPGVDLRPIGRGSQTFAYGFLPSTLQRELRDKVMELAGRGRAAITRRSE